MTTNTNDFLLPLNLQFFAEDDGADEKPPADTKPPADDLPKSVTMSQADLDALIGKAKGQVKKQYADYDETKAELARLKALEDEATRAALSETERLQTERDEASTKATQAEERAINAQEKADARIINTEIKSIARSLSANDPTDILALLDKSSVTIDENGDVVGIEDAVKALKEAKPWMFKQASVGADASGGSNPSKNPSANELTAKEKELAEAKVAAQKNPKLSGLVTRLYNEIIELKNKR